MRHNREVEKGMVDLWDGLIQAFWLVVSFDAELADIALRSLYVTFSALAIACLIAFPLAALIQRRFRSQQQPTESLDPIQSGVRRFRHRQY